jgi:hypothetical protein
MSNKLNAVSSDKDGHFTYRVFDNCKGGCADLGQICSQDERRFTDSPYTKVSSLLSCVKSAVANFLYDNHWLINFQFGSGSVHTIMSKSLKPPG